MKAIAIITARGGSKRIPRKNIKNFLGQPIIKYSIDSALASGFDEVMVSTDDQEIADMAIEFGAKVPFLRSQKNSDDHATTTDVILEVLAEYDKLGRDFDFACCVYPTAPFVTAPKLIAAMDLLRASGADSVLPVVEFDSSIQRAFKIDDDGTIKMYWPEHMNARSQDLEPAYHDCGQFYCINVKKFLNDKQLFTNNTLPIITPRAEVQDIDTEEDWKMAEIKYKILKNIL